MAEIGETNKTLRRSRRRRSGDAANDGTAENINNNFEEALRRSRRIKRKGGGKRNENENNNMENLSLNDKSERTDASSGKGGSRKRVRNVSDSGGGINSTKKKRLLRRAKVEMEWTDVAGDLEAAKEATAEVRKRMDELQKRKKLMMEMEANIEKEKSATEVLKKRILALKNESEKIYELERVEHERRTAERKELKAAATKATASRNGSVVGLLKKEIEAQAEIAQYQETQKGELDFLKNVVQLLKEKGAAARRG